MVNRRLLSILILFSFNWAWAVRSADAIETPVSIVEDVMQSIGMDHPIWDIGVDIEEDTGVSIYNFKIEIKSGNDYDKIDKFQLSLIPMSVVRSAMSSGGKFEVIVSGRRNGRTVLKNKQAYEIFKKVLSVTKEVKLVEPMSPKYILGTYAGYVTIKNRHDLKALLTQIEKIVVKIDKEGLENVIGIVND